MFIDKYKKVKSFLHPAIRLPEDFFLPSSHGAESCVFFLSCLGNDKVLFLEDSFHSLSGYPSERLTREGMDFWFSLIHPEDRNGMSEKIIESHQSLALHGFNEAAPVPLVLTYRIKRANGDWIWIKDTKFLVSFSEKKIDKVLGKFEEFWPERRSETDLKKTLEGEESCTQLLEFALVHQNDKRKQILSPQPSDKELPIKPVPALTKREKEILQLVAEGLSTKLIADKCNISIHTVETHRRHLLEKLQVKNSMELVKEASKIYWL